MSGLLIFAALTISTSSFVEMWQSVSLVLCLIAISRAFMVDFMQALRLLIFSCSSNGISSPYFSLAFARFSLMVCSSSQCTRTGFWFMANTSSRALPESTSIFPVEDPMNTFNPAKSFALMPVCSSPLMIILCISATFLFVTPRWNMTWFAPFSAAIPIFSLSAAADIVGGLVFGISITVVTPPARAARDSVPISAFCTSPGSLKCTWASIPPAIMHLPWISIICRFSNFFER